MSDISIMKRAMIFIDGQNLFYGCRGYQDDYKIDYDKLRKECSKKYDLIRSYFYSGKDPEDEKQESFHTALRYSGFDVKTRPLVKIDDGRKEKGIDVMLTTDLLTHAFKDNFDIAVIIGGDLDYVQAIQEVKNEGKIIKLVSFEGNMSKKLKQMVDETLILDDIADKIKR